MHLLLAPGPIPRLLLRESSIAGLRPNDSLKPICRDPCGAAGVPQARDEYHGYVPVVFRMLQGGADAVALANHLADLEQEGMGLAGDPSGLLPIGEILVRWRSHLASPHS